MLKSIKIIFKRSFHLALIGLILSTQAAIFSPHSAIAAVPTLALSFKSVATGISNPTVITHANDARLFLVEQDGRIKILQNGAVLSSLFLDIAPLVKCCGEEGLLGLAFEPNYAQTGRFYVYYTNNDGDEVIARYAVGSNPNVADPNSGVILLTIPHPTNGNHNGGWLGFGPDGFLYAATGDGGGGGDPFCAAQNLNDLRGKLLRLGVSGAVTYTTPVSNVVGGRPEVWAFGLRNPWRNSFDRQTGELYIADVGQGAREEVNLAPASASAGTNFGWSQREGAQAYDGAHCPVSPTPAQEPFFDYGHDIGSSITGGYVYRGAQFPAANGVYFFSDFISRRIWAAQRPSPGSLFSVQTVAQPGFGISTFGEDSAGELYAASYGAGQIYQIQFQSLTPRAYLPVLSRA